MPKKTIKNTKKVEVKPKGTNAVMKSKPEALKEMESRKPKNWLGALLLSIFLGGLIFFQFYFFCLNLNFSIINS